MANIPYSSPAEIDALVQAGMMDALTGQQAKDQFFPAPAPAPVVAQAPAPSNSVAMNPALDAPMAPSENMGSAIPATPVPNPVAQMPTSVTTSSSQSQNVRMAPGALKAGKDATEAYAQSAQDLMEATAAHNNSIAEQRAGLAMRRFEDVERDAAKREMETAELESRRNEIRSQIDSIASQKVNSGRFYQNMGAGDKVLAAISVALGGFASAMQGRPGENAALGIIDKAVQRDIDEQIKNLDNSRQTLALKDQDLARLIQITGSKQAARDALMAKQYEALVAQIDAKAANTPDQVIKARAQDLANQLRLQVAQKQMDVERNVTQFTSATQPLGKMGAGERLPADAAKHVADSRAAQEALSSLEKMGKEVGTGPVKGRLESAGEMVGAMSPKMATLQSELNLAAATVGKSLFGNMSESERQIAMTKIFPTINDSPAQFKAKLDGVKARLEAAANAQADVYSQSGYNVPRQTPKPREK